MSNRINLDFKADNFSSIALLGGLIFLMLGIVSINFLMFIVGISLVVLGTGSQLKYLSRMSTKKYFYNKNKSKKGFTMYKPNSKQRYR